MLNIRQVYKYFGEHQALADVSLEFQPGEFFSVLGPSGCGKSTLLRILAGFEQPDSGSVWLDGADITRLPPQERPTNMVFQRYALFPHLNVADNVGFSLRLKSLSNAERQRRVLDALNLVAMEGMGQRRVQSLSGGQQQRVALARAIICKPRVLLLDEPLSALDLHLRRHMQTELRSLQRRLGMTFVFITHDQGEALSISDRLAVMSRGRIEQIGAPAVLYDRPATDFVASFLGTMNRISVRYVAPCDQGSHQIWVDIGGQKRLRARWSKGRDLPAVGALVQMLVRPEKMQISQLQTETGLSVSEDGHEIALPCLVKDLAFHGATTQITAELSGLGAEVTATHLNRDYLPHGLAPGSRMQVGFRLDQVLVAPATEDL